MSNIPSNLKYTKTHEWVELKQDGTVTVGISDHAQDLLGDVVYVELPQAGRKAEAGKACAVVESVKAASDIYCPISGEIIEANGTLSDKPELVNQDAYGQAWMFRINPADPAELNRLLDAAAYAAFVAAEAH